MVKPLFYKMQLIYLISNREHTRPLSWKRGSVALSSRTDLCQTGTDTRLTTILSKQIIQSTLSYLVFNIMKMENNNSFLN